MMSADPQATSMGWSLVIVEVILGRAGALVVARAGEGGCVQRRAWASEGLTETQTTVVWCTRAMRTQYKSQWLLKDDVVSVRLHANCAALINGVPCSTFAGVGMRVGLGPISAEPNGVPNWRVVLTGGCKYE